MMLSRVAESMYWLCRYIERAENVARFVEVHDALSVGGGKSRTWDPLVAITGDQAFFEERYGQANRANVIRFLTFDREYPNSIVSCLAAARENGRTIRDRLSLAFWEALNKLYLMVHQASEGRLKGAAQRTFFDEVKLHSHMLAGILDNTISRGELWHFGRFGRLMERADKTSRILDVKYFILLPDTAVVGTPLDIVQWSALLSSTDCAIEYRRQHGRIAPEMVVGFLMLDGRFPSKEFGEQVRSDVVLKLTHVTIQLWNHMKQKMLPTPAKFHYVFNMRELSRVRHDSLRRYFVVRDAIVRGAIANVHAADQYCANILAQARSEIRLIKLESFTQRRRLRERQKRERDAELWI